ncbi:hypothetical protein CsSME_00046979 [Camellia sinensis var. sinensis]
MTDLSYSTSETCLRKENFGQLAEVKLVMDEKVKRSKGYAFIQYTSQDDALLALESMDHKSSSMPVAWMKIIEFWSTTTLRITTLRKHLLVEVTVASSLVGEHELEFAFGLHEDLPFFVRKCDHISFIKISKLAIFSSTKT